MVTKVFCLQPREGKNWLSPAEVSARLKSSFDNVTEDHDLARKLGDQFVSAYRELKAAGIGDLDSLSVEEVEKHWFGAVMVRISDPDAKYAYCEFIAKNRQHIELRFAPKADIPKETSNCGEDC